MCRWATIALTTLLIRLLTVPLLINQLKSMMKLNVMHALQNLIFIVNALFSLMFVNSTGHMRAHKLVQFIKFETKRLKLPKIDLEFVEAKDYTFLCIF